ncbi:UbiA family prenyltransferase [Algicella marina]|uniref:UbiA family prenyltransferase n=1 Tax=Algicella marina TaxID=2683284 RepID=A0A6P1T3M5_9RHOB|nr:UbiA family prenyltransferase [Algicella marina]QHQ36345.1 UbiA family prenyltransferase [Algicella marina]
MSEGKVLAVDLDGTLLKGDMLLETWWNVLSRDRKASLRALQTLREKGRAAFKEALAADADVDIARLPYNTEMIEYIGRRKAAGDRIVLATASDIRVAEAVAAELGLFDEVIASDGKNNLKGAGKETVLVERFGRKGFDYAGDHAADLDVWRSADTAVTVNAAENLRQQAAAVAGKAEHLGRSEPDYRAWMKAMRPHQWLKNVLVFVPLLASHSSEVYQWVQCLVAFVTFSLVASSVYLFNDLLDLSADRAHPRKCERPLAKGTMRLEHGSVLAPGLLAGGLLLAILFLRYEFVLVLMGYFVLTTVYSLVLKRKLIIDIVALAGLYTVRIFAGAVAAWVVLSPWILVLSIFLFLSLAAIKRQAELISDIAVGKESSSGRAYMADDLPVVTGMALAAGYVAVMVLALYISAPGVTELYTSPKYLFGITPIVLYWISRAVMITHRGFMTDDPIIFAIKDNVSRLCGLGVLVILFFAAFF